jgi:phage protein U
MTFALFGDTPLRTPVYMARMDGRQGVDYAEQAVIEGKPLLQFIGEAAETLEIEVTLPRALCDPAAELDRLRGMMGEHKAWPLTFGNGLYRGRYAITALEIANQVMDGLGNLDIITIRLSLKEHSEPPQIETMKNPPAVSSSGPKPAAKPKGPEYRLAETTNKDGVPVRKIVRAE